MSSHKIWPKSGGVPLNYEILKTRTKGCVPDNVGIDLQPLGSDIYTGASIPRVLPSDKRYLLPEDRIAWLEENLACRGWDIIGFLDPATLIHLSTARRSATYLPFILANPNLREIDLFKDICSVNVELCCTEDSMSLIQANFQEREAELAQYSNSEDCVSGATLIVGPEPGDREKSPSPPVLRRSPAMLHRSFWVWAHPMYLLRMVGIRNTQMTRFQAVSRQICEKMGTLELSGNRIKECETELEQQRDELRNLRSSQSTVRMKVERLKQELVDAARNRDKEYQANTK
ncbi:unnamed protein product [Prunus armeniaca]